LTSLPLGCTYTLGTSLFPAHLNRIFIYRDHVLTFLWGEKPTAYVIKSKQDYEAHRKFFEEMWQLGVE
jgi:hypothetical protein